MWYFANCQFKSYFGEKSSNAAAKQSTKRHGLRTIHNCGMVLARRVRSTPRLSRPAASSYHQSRAWKTARGTCDACRIACRREPMIAAELPAALVCLLLCCFFAANSQTMLQLLLITPEIMLLASITETSKKKNKTAAYLSCY
jgi:hypothetical protein